MLKFLLKEQEIKKQIHAYLLAFLSLSLLGLSSAQAIPVTISTLSDPASGTEAASNCSGDETAGYTCNTLRDFFAKAQEQHAADPTLKIYEISFTSGGVLTLSGDAFFIDTEDTYTINGGGSLSINGNASSAIFTGYFSLIDLTLNNLVLENSTGIIVALGAHITANNCSFLNSTTTDNGAAILIGTGSLNITNSNFSGNSSTKSGGAIYASNASEINIQGSTFSDNTATNNGGAIYIDAPITTTIVNSSFYNNEATGTGGALYLTDSSAGEGGGGAVYDIANSTFYGNTASSAGGIINGASTLNLTHVTLEQNTANGAGQAQNLFNFSTGTSIRNSIIGTPGTGDGPSCTTVNIATSTHNLYYTSDAEVANASSCLNFSAETDLSTTDILGNFNESLGVVELLEGSQAIGNAEFLEDFASDQLGNSRSAGATDIGAYQKPASSGGIDPNQDPGYCGDGMLDPGEECDDGALNGQADSPNQCATNCTPLSPLFQFGNENASSGCSLSLKATTNHLGTWLVFLSILGLGLVRRAKN
ncbi:MAG: hypothetical protein KDK66_07120 [Deltaproteobacteria bacterium]|nr:hypothetical protein [Deltaproteobacteria bacterium]